MILKTKSTPYSATPRHRKGRRPLPEWDEFQKLAADYKIES